MGGAIGTTSASLFQSMPMKLLPTKKVLRRMRDHMLPNERVFILEGLTELNNRARRPLLLGDAAVIEIVRGGGVELVVDALRLYQDWEPLLSMAMQLLCPLCRHDDTIRRLLEHDGHFVIQKVVREQETDSFIREDGREIIEAINVQGAILTLNLIRDVITDMCYCDQCRPLAEVRRVCAHYGGGSSGAKEGEGDVAMIRLQRLIDPIAYDTHRKERDVAAVRLLSQSMADFAKSSRVQEAGADGLIAFAREGATRSYLLKDPEVVKGLGKALRMAVDNFPLNPAVLWKAMRATHLLSANESLCVELVKVGMIPQALRVYKTSDDPDVKQEAIWALSEMSRSIMGRDVIEEGPGWKVIHQILKAQEKGRRDDSVVLPMQLKTLFTKDKYHELFKLEKTDEKVQQEERKQQKQARVENESVVKSLLHRTAKPKFGTVEERLRATTAAPQEDPEVTMRGTRATMNMAASTTRGSLSGQSLRVGSMSKTNKTALASSTSGRLDDSGSLTLTSTLKGTTRGGPQYPALMAPAAE